MALRTVRAWREWAKRWNLLDFPSGAFPLSSEVQPVIIVDDVTRLSMRPQRIIYAFGNLVAGPTVAEYSTFRLVCQHPARVRAWEIQVTGNYYVGFYPGTLTLLNAASLVSSNQLEGPIDPYWGTAAPPYEVDYDTTATVIGAGAGGGVYTTSVRYSGLDYLILPGQFLHFQAITSNQAAILKYLEIELLPWNGFNEIENQPASIG